MCWGARLTLICEKNATEMLMKRPGLNFLLKRSLHALPACTRISNYSVNPSQPHPAAASAETIPLVRWRILV